MTRRYVSLASTLLLAALVAVGGAGAQARSDTLLAFGEHSRNWHSATLLKAPEASWRKQNPREFTRIKAYRAAVMQGLDANRPEPINTSYGRMHVASARLAALDMPGGTMAGMQAWHGEYAAAKPTNLPDARWRKLNPLEARRWDEFRTAILNGERPKPPAMGTSYGRALVAVGELALLQEPGPPAEP